MSSKEKIRIASPKLSPELQREVDELRRVFADTQKYMEKLKISGKSENFSNEARKMGNDLLMQKGHDVKIHRDILKRYSQSIALAPLDSEEFVLGYDSRLAFLMHVQHYKEALIDIDKALQLSKSDDYKKKMQACKDECLRLLNEQNLIKSTKSITLEENKELEKIRSKVESFKPSDTVACAADCVGVAYDKELGRHLVATRDIEPGEFIIVEEGYVCSPILSEIYIVCSHCCQYAWNGIPCKKCILAIYCSEECKNKALKEYHDIECPILEYMHHIVFNTPNGVPVVTIFRLLVTALRKEGFESVMKEICKERNEGSIEELLSDGILKNDFKACYNLSPWIKDVGEEYKQLELQILQILYLLVNYTDFLSLMKTNPSVDKTTMNFPEPVIHDNGTAVVDPWVLLKFKEALIRLKFIASTNGYPIHTGTWQCGYCDNLDEHLIKCHLMRGSTIVPCCSLINHSCTPNVAYIAVPKKTFIASSTCPIKKGEMLCAAYKSICLLQGDVKTRETTLKSFVCKCRACLENINPQPIMDERVKDSSKIRDLLRKHISSSVAKLYFEKSSDDYEMSEKKFQQMMSISQFLYKHMNYYKAYIHCIKCYTYLEIMMAKLYKDKIYMPNDC